MSGISMSRRSEQGGRAYNEDCTMVGQAPFGWFAILSDGAGGHLNGARASQLSVQTACDILRDRDGLDSELVSAAIVGADRALKDEIASLAGNARMAATIVVLGIERTGEHAVWAHVGDSRLYLLRGGRLVHLTRDDSVVQQLVEAGWIDEAGARNHPSRSQLLAALGGDDPVSPHVLDAPWGLADGDAFLLCSDGWWEGLDHETILACLAAASSVDAWLDAMLAQVRARGKPNQDNFSAIGVWIGNPNEVTRLVGV